MQGKRDRQAILTRHDLQIAAQWSEKAARRNPSLAPPAKARRIDPQSPEGRAIAKRYAKPAE